MFRISTSRLFVIKFLGLFGSRQETFVQDSADEVPGTEAKSSDQWAGKKLPPNHEDQHYEAKKTSSKKVVGLILEKGIPGLIICVSKKGRIVWHSAFGFCDVENQLECKPEARMRIASISKSMFASTVVGPLIDEQKIDIKSSIHKYLSEDEFPKQKYNDKEVDITIEHLLSHTSGIRHYEEDREEDKRLRPLGSTGSESVYQSGDQYERKGFFQRKTFRSVFEALEPFRNDTLRSEPGTAFKYTTYGYTLLSAVIERILDRSTRENDDKKEPVQIEDFWMKILRNDWKLCETSLDLDEPILANRARHYLRSGINGNLINAPYTDNSVKWAGGGIISSTSDLVKFGIALIDSYKSRPDAKLKSETIKKLWTEIKGSYGLGFSIKDLDTRQSGNEKKAYYHLGVALGASSALILYPESEVVVAILTNLGNVNLLPLGLFVADQFAKSL